MAITRRQFLEGLGLVGFVYLFTPGFINTNHIVPLRPPGAIPEEAFNIKCIRCFKCGEVCPTGAVQFGGWLEGQYADTPMLTSIETNPCNLCMECTKVCPTGALNPLEPELKTIVQNVKIGVASIHETDCVISNGRRSFCYFCVQVCPLGKAAIGFDKSGNPIVNEEYCVGCGQCVGVCPTRAISIRRV